MTSDPKKQPLTRAEMREQQLLNLPAPSGSPAFAAEGASTPIKNDGNATLGCFVLIAIIFGIGMLLFKGCSDLGVDEKVIQGLNAEVYSMGSMNFASYKSFQYVESDGPGSVAIHTTMYDKPENETYAKAMCGSMRSVVLNVEGAQNLTIRVLSSSDTTLVYCK